MDLEFNNQDIILSDEYHYERITNAIKNLFIGKKFILFIERQF